MAWSVAATEYRATHPIKIKYHWTSDVNGNAAGSTAHEYSGRLIGFTTISSGIHVASSGYDVVLHNDDGVDMLFGLGENRTVNVVEHLSSDAGDRMGVAHGSKLTLRVANAGNEKRGVVFAFIG